MVLVLFNSVCSLHHSVSQLKSLILRHNSRLGSKKKKVACTFFFLMVSLISVRFDHYLLLVWCLDLYIKYLLLRCSVIWIYLFAYLLLCLRCSVIQFLQSKIVHFEQCQNLFTGGWYRPINWLIAFICYKLLLLYGPLKIHLTSSRSIK